MKLTLCGKSERDRRTAPSTWAVEVLSIWMGGCAILGFEPSVSNEPVLAAGARDEGASSERKRTTKPFAGRHVEGSPRHAAAAAHSANADRLAAAGDLDAAVAEYRVAIRIDPPWAEPRNRLGVALASRNDIDDVDKAIATYRRAIYLKPDYAEAHFNMGRALASKGHSAGAAVALVEAIRLDPSRAEFLDAFAHFLANDHDPLVRDPRRAKAFARSAVELAPREPLYWRTLGEVQYLAGEWAECQPALERSWRLAAGADPCAALWLARALERSGDPDAARAWFTRASAWIEACAPADDDAWRLRPGADAPFGPPTECRSKQRERPALDASRRSDG